MSEANPYAAPAANVVSADEQVDIDALDVSDTWKQRFKAMQKAGGPGMPKRSELSKEERKKLFHFSVLGFFFGPLYYFSKGMWKKGFTLCVLVVAGVTIVELVMAAVGLKDFGRYLNVVGPAIFASRAHIDYYKKMVMKDRSWL